MPPTITCNNCGFTYYQTSAAHVCNEYRKGETMSTTIENYCIDCKAVAKPDCEQRGHVVGTLGQSSTKPAAKHEPAARGEGDGLWNIEGGSLVGQRRIRDVMSYWIADASSNERAEQIVTEHNSHAALVEQRDRLLVVLRLVRDAYNQGPSPEQIRLAMDGVIDYVDEALNE